jgi:hypothetical protein
LSPDDELSFAVLLLLAAFGAGWELSEVTRKKPRLIGMLYALCVIGIVVAGALIAQKLENYFDPGVLGP